MRTLIYVHIPKTAGTTLRYSLQQYAGDGGLFSAYPKAGAPHRAIQDWPRLSADEKRHIRVVSGHYHFDLLDQIIDVDDKAFLTFLRNPIDRVISLYKHVMATHRDYLNNPVSLLKFTTESSSDLQVQLTNHQTRIIAGIPPTIPITQEMLDSAKNLLLNRFFFVGTTENFSSDIENLSKSIGEKLSSTNPKNVSNDRTTVEYYSKVELNILKDMNKFDIELHKFVKENRKQLQHHLFRK